MLKAKKYENYKPSGVDFIGNIPEHWEVKKLKFLVDRIIGGGTPLTSNSDYWTENRDDGLLWVAIADITKSEYIQDTKKYITEEGLKNSSTQRVEPYSILYSIYASLGKVAYSPHELTTNQAILAIKPNEELLYKFLFYYLKTLEDKLPFLSSSTTQNNISLDVVKNFNITQPPYDEQEKIVKFIDIKNKEIEKFISYKQKQIALLEEQKEAIINKAVTKGLNEIVAFKDSGIEWIGDIPKHWNISKTKYISDIFIPQRNKPELNEDNGYLWITLDELKNDYIEQSFKKVSENDMKEAASKLLPKNSVIASCVGEFGIASINLVNCVINQQLQAFTNVKINPKFLLYIMRISKYYFYSIATETTLLYVNKYGFANLPIVYPPENEQKEIIKYIEMEQSKIDKVINQIQKEIDLIEEYKISLISEVVTGQIDVR